MRGFITTLGIALILSTLFSPDVQGQDFRVYTCVQHLAQSNAGEGTASSPVVARSLTLFHAGKAYDYIDSVGELTVFEPTLKQFIILNGSRLLATRLTWDQLAELQRIGEQETQNYISRMKQKKQPRYRAVVEMLEYQLFPEFTEQYDAKSGRLDLVGKRLSYHVQCADAATPEAVEVYLRYADWTARLNHVLHANSMLPASRLKLNESLRTRRKLPVQVELVANLDRPVRLRAEHRIHWDLSPKDRSYINHWESELHNDAVRYVSFQEYQQTTLVANRDH